MRREDLLGKLKYKILIVGDSGAGKTYACVRCAESYGGKVLYLDVDDGAVLELMGLEDKDLERIDHVNVHSIPQIRDMLNKNEYGLVIFDILYPHLKDWARLYVRELLLKQGYYYVGEKKVKIENPETFDLRGFMYSLPNNIEKEIFKKLRDLDAHIVATAYPIDDSDKRNMIYGFFDIVLRIYNSVNGKRICKVEKVRGAGREELVKKFEQDYIKTLQGLFRGVR